MTAIATALGVAALALPIAAQAQSYGGYGQGGYGQGGPGYGQGGYGYGQGYGGYGGRGDYYGGRGGGYGGFSGYPEFRGIENHIRSEIIQAVRFDMIERDDASDLMNQLRQIQMWERREFSYHGWNLPPDDRERIRNALDQLDHEVDRIRDEP
jgi:hypothetical protein